MGNQTNWEKGIFRVCCVVAVVWNALLLTLWFQDDGIPRTAQDVSALLQASIFGSAAVLVFGLLVGWSIRGFRS